MNKKFDLAAQQEKLSGLMNSAKLKTTAVPDAVPGKEASSEIKTSHKNKSRSKNLRAVPETYFEAHASLKAANKTSLDFSSYILEAIRAKLESDGALEQHKQ